MVPAGSRLHLAIQIYPDYQKSELDLQPKRQKDFHRLRKPGLSVSSYQGVADAEEPFEWWNLVFNMLQLVSQLVGCCGPRGPQQPTNW